MQHHAKKRFGQNFLVDTSIINHIVDSIQPQADDLMIEIGPGLGGNKTRKLEFSMGEAQERGADTIITVGAVQSNHVRQTAAAACRCNPLNFPATGTLTFGCWLGSAVRFALAIGSV